MNAHEPADSFNPPGPNLLTATDLLELIASGQPLLATTAEAHELAALAGGSDTIGRTPSTLRIALPLTVEVCPDPKPIPSTSRFDPGQPDRN